MKKTYIKPALEVVHLMMTGEVLAPTSFVVSETAGGTQLSDKKDSNSGPWNNDLWGTEGKK